MISGQFNDSYQPITDGVASVTQHYADGLGKLLGPESAYVITPSYPGYSDPPSHHQVIRYRSVSMKQREPYRIGLPQLDPDLSDQLERIPFDILHAQCPFSSGRLALKLAKKKKIPVVASFHTKYLEDIIPVTKSIKLAKLVLKNLMQVYEQADEVWTVNQNTISTMREYGYIGPVRVIENGTDLAAADPGCRRSAACDKIAGHLKIEDDEKVLFFIGQHIWQKNLRLLIESLQHLKQAMPGKAADRPVFRMFFIGGGDAAGEMKELVKNLGLDREVAFLGIIRDREFVRGLYERADLLLFPSKYDTSALVLRESAAALCPMVLVEGATMAEGIQDHDNAFLARDNARDFAEKVKQALDNPGHCLDVGLRAQQTLYRSWDTVVSEVEQAYAEIIDQKKKTLR